MAGAISGVVLARATVGSATTLTWDAGGASPVSPADGGGTWDTTTGKCSNGTSDGAWNNAAPATAAFGNGGTAGTVTLGTAITAAGLTFGATGSGSYTVGASTDALTLTTGDISVATGVTAAVSSPVYGSNGLTVTGGGELEVGGVGNTVPTAYTGTTAVDGSTLQFNNLGTSTNYGVGAIELGGATSTVISGLSKSVALTIGGNISVDDGTQATIDFSQRTSFAAGTNLSGGSTSSLTINYGTSVARDVIYSSASAFKGTLNIQSPNSNGGELALVTGGQSYISGTSYGNFDGLPGTFNVSGAITTAGPVAGSTITIGALGGASTGVIDAPLNAGTVTWSIGGLGASTQYAGAINADNGTTTLGANAIKLTGGTLALTGSNTYTGGTTVSGGTLRVNNAAGSGTGSGAVTVAAGATLGGSGSIVNTAGPVTVYGTIGGGTSPTDAGSTLHTGAQVWNPGATLLTQFSQAGGSVTGSDQLIATGLTVTSLTAANSFTVDVSNVGTGAATLPASGPGSFIVLATDTDGSSANPFNASGTAPINLAALELQTSGLVSATGSFQFATQPGDGGFDLVLEDATAAAPEPASLLLAGVAIAPLALSRRRRRAAPSA